MRRETERSADKENGREETEGILLQEILKCLSRDNVHKVYVFARTLAQIEQEKKA